MNITPTAGRRDRARAHLPATLFAEDNAEEQLGLSPHERRTCPVHRRWLYECVSSPEHAIRVTGHRWCRRCDRPLAVAVDELGGTVTFSCTQCRRFPDSAANRQILRSCRASMQAARQDRIPALPIQTELQAA
ncbi:MAG: hypothetical protein ACRDQW_08015 [Haloechinothrix sp.]